MSERVGSDTHTVVFQPSGVRGTVEAGITLRSAALRLGVEIESICGDRAICGKCFVAIEDGRIGRVASSYSHASPLRLTEEQWIRRRVKAWKRLGLDPQRLRLSCQAEVQGDLVVFVPESSRGNRQIIRKSANYRPFELRPAIRRYYVELESPTLDNPRGDFERLVGQLIEVMKRVHPEPDGRTPAPEDMSIDYHTLRLLANALRDGDWKVSVTVWQDVEILDVHPGYKEALYGIAVDVGSTAVATYVCDLTTGEVISSESMMNPQVAFGDDIISRMAYECEHDGGLATLHESVVSGLNSLIERARRAAQIERDDILDLVVVGNTTMHHLLLGLTTKHLSAVPFVPVCHGPLDFKARELALAVHPATYVHTLPIVASFVGADAMGVILAEEPHKHGDMVLIIDIGTNAELVLGNRDGLICTSTPTGPAFEGAHVEHGMRAAVGAIEHIKIDDESLEPSYQVIGTDEWDPTDPVANRPVKGICGSAVIDGVAEMFRVGIIGPRGHFVDGVDTRRVRQGELGWEYVIAWERETSSGGDVAITLEDVRQIQFAKAALYTAARILLRELGLETPDKVILAGAFGTHIDTTSALILGMIPDCPLDRVFSVGNAAGDGGRIALLNRHKRVEAARIATTIRRVELPVDSSFQSEYVRAMDFPHMSDPFPSVAHLIPDRAMDSISKGRPRRDRA